MRTTTRRRSGTWRRVAKGARAARAVRESAHPLSAPFSQVGDLVARVGDSMRLMMDAPSTRVTFLHDGRVWALKFFSKQVRSAACAARPPPPPR